MCWPASYVFNTKNRIFAIDTIFTSHKSNNYNQVYYINSTLKIYKFILLKQTKLLNLLKLPLCKVVTLEMFKSNGNKKLFYASVLIDKVLQCMFFTFLSVFVEEKLKPKIFLYRKGCDSRITSASVYSKLNQAKYFEQICLCFGDIKKILDNVLHSQIIKQCFFPKSCNFLLLRWLTPSFVGKNWNSKKLKLVNRGILHVFALGLSITNFLLSNNFPKNALKKKRKNKIKVWAKNFFYLSNVLLITNDSLTFYVQLIKLKKNLKKIGLFFNDKKTKIFDNIKNKFKFQFLGFEFKVMLREQLKKSFLFSNIKNIYFMKENTQKFVIIFCPRLKKVKNVKKRLKIVIKTIFHQFRNKIYKSFQQVNLILLSWISYYYFNQGWVYGGKVDYFIFKYLKKMLVKKFRYDGLLRPKWVSRNFLCTGKVNPNCKKWQFLMLQYVKNSLQIDKHVYIWCCKNSFYKLPISFFFFNSKMHKKNYYIFKYGFKKTLNKLVIKRLKSGLKIKHFRNV